MPVLSSVVDIIVESTPEAAAEAAAGFLAHCIHETAGDCTFGLAGGSTPVAAYRKLRTLDVDWERVTGWLPDERFVPPDHEDSNALLARRELVDHVPLKLLAPDTTIADPAAAAAAYEAALGPVFNDGRPDVVLLGMGDDGHTASLFPGTSALDVDRPGYVATWVDRLDCWRLTATLPLLGDSRRIVFLVTGEHKADMIRRILGEGEPFPARLVAESAGEVRWVLDEPAASLL